MPYGLEDFNILEDPVILRAFFQMAESPANNMIRDWAIRTLAENGIRWSGINFDSHNDRTPIHKWSGHDSSIDFKQYQIIHDDFLDPDPQDLDKLLGT